jgi:ATP/maltotriose-dependent transcriptional regulator MalT
MEAGCEVLNVTDALLPIPGGDFAPRPISTDVSGAGGLVDRKDLLQLLDRAVTKRVTVISAPPGSGKTSLLRAWAKRSHTLRRVAFVTVQRDQQNEHEFWSAVLEAVRGAEPVRVSVPPPTPTAAFDEEQVIKNLDNWDPALIDALASRRRVLTFDNAGVGRGVLPRSVICRLS